MRISRKLLICTTLVLVIIAAVSPVAAAGYHSVFSTQQIERTSLVPSPCLFVITEHTFGTLQITDHVNDAGVPIWTNFKWELMNTVWSANRKVLNFQVSGPVHVDTPSATLTVFRQLGTNTFLTLPGYGRVYGSAGHFAVQYEYVDGVRTVTPIKDAGTPDVASWNAICAYLAR